MSRRDRNTRVQAVVKKAMWIKAGRHHPQFMRPFGLNATDSNIEMMLDELGNSDATVDTVGAWGSDIIYVNGQVDDEDEALIPHGWDGDRYQFFWEVEVGSRISSDRMRFFVTGFTESDTLMETEKDHFEFDDDTRLFINSIIRLRSSGRSEIGDLVASGGNVDRTTIESNAHLLIAYTADDHLNRESKDFESLRPMDIASRLDSDGDNVMGDTRRDFSTSTYKASSRNNALSTNYLAQTLGSLVAGDREYRTEKAMRDKSTSRYSKAQRLLSESAGQKCRLTTLLKDETNFRRNGYVTWGEVRRVLLDIDNNDISMILDREDAERVGRSSRTADMEGETWRGADAETTVSYASLNAITGIMMESGIILASFNAHNEDRSGDIEFSFSRRTAPIFMLDDLDEEDMEDLIALMISRLEQFVFDPIAHRHDRFYLEASVDATGDSFFDISLQGEQTVEFCAPTYADGSTGSMLASHDRFGTSLSYDMDKMSEALIAR